MRTILLAGTAFAALAQPALGQTDTEIQTRPVEDTIIVTGTRGQSRTAIESLAPVDVITADAIDTVVSDELVDSLAAFAYENPRRIVGRDAVVEQHDVRMTRRDGAEVVLDVCIILRFDTEGRIVRIDEYLDSAGVAPLQA